MFNHPDIDNYEEAHRLVAKLQANPKDFKAVLFNEAEQLNPCIAQPNNFLALEKLFELLSEEALFKIVPKINFDKISQEFIEDEVLFERKFPKLTQIYINVSELSKFENSGLEEQISDENEGAAAINPNINSMEDGIYKEDRIYKHDACGKLLSVSRLNKYGIPEIEKEFQYDANGLVKSEITYLKKLVTVELYRYDAYGKISDAIKKEHSISSYKSEPINVIRLLSFSQADFANYIHQIYMIETVADQAILATSLIELTLKEIQDCSIISSLTKLIDFYLFPFKELSIDNVKQLVHELAKQNTPISLMIMGYLLNQAADYHSKDGDFPSETIEIMLLDAMRHLTHALTARSVACQKTAKELLWHITETYGDEFKYIKKYYKKIQILCGEKIDTKQLFSSSGFFSSAFHIDSNSESASLNLVTESQLKFKMEKAEPKSKEEEDVHLQTRSLS